MGKSNELSDQPNMIMGTSLVAQMVKRLPTMRETQVQSWVGKISWRRKWQPTLVFLPGKSHGRRNLVGYSPWGAKCQTRLSDLTNKYDMQVRKQQLELDMEQQTGSK